MSALDHRSTGSSPRKLGLDREGGKIGGVCSGLARYFGIDPLVVRLLFVIGTVAGVGSLLLVYLVMWLVGALMD
ncbi:MAG TPA: PspC domain-containing protein [Paracoccaceae bacterium]|nr:PspC domain-containing protein [Paracoccaceae bacterium]